MHCRCVADVSCRAFVFIGTAREEEGGCPGPGHGHGQILSDLDLDDCVNTSTDEIAH